MNEMKRVLKDWAQRARYYSSDSRRVGPEGIFVALRGEKTDGHHYVSQVLHRGCLGAVVDRESLKDLGAVAADARLLVVENCHLAHRQLAYEFRRKFLKPIIGVGGSSGKTSTKDFLAHLLSARYKVFKTEKSQNGEQGIPKTFENLADDFDLAVIEIGIDAPGDMQRHVEIVEPDVALLTSIGEEHLNLLKTVDNVFREEMKLFENVWSRGGRAFAPRGDRYLASLRHTNLQLTPARPEELDPTFVSKLEHPYLLQNAALASAVALAMNCEPGEVAQQLLTLEIPEGRGGVVWKHQRLAVISDYYNSNPSSVRGGLLNAKKLASQHALPLILILGDMLDLGEASAHLHEELLSELSSFSGALYLVGPQMLGAVRRQGLAAAGLFADRSEAQDYFRKHKPTEGVVLVKASRGIGLESVFHILTE